MFIENRSKRSGFTMMELIIVIVILGIMTAAFVVNSAGASDSSKGLSINQDISKAKTALGKVSAEYGRTWGGKLTESAVDATPMEDAEEGTCRYTSTANGEPYCAKSTVLFEKAFYQSLLEEGLVMGDLDIFELPGAPGVTVSFPADVMGYRFIRITDIPGNVASHFFKIANGSMDIDYEIDGNNPSTRPVLLVKSGSIPSNLTAGIKIASEFFGEDSFFDNMEEASLAPVVDAYYLITAKGIRTK